MKKTLFNKEKGITLVALIITIIILLILASVTISSISGDGIIEKAKEAKTEWEEASKREAEWLESLGKIDTTTDDTTLTKQPTGFIFQFKGINEEGRIVSVANLSTGALIGKEWAGAGVREDGIGDGTTYNDDYQFVWISVDTPVAEDEEDLLYKISQGKYPMALKVEGKDECGRQNYIGLQYEKNYSGGWSLITTIRTTTYPYTDTTNAKKEPATIPLALEEMGLQAGSYGATTAEEFNKILQEDFNEMVSRVIKRGGFYIARYKTSLSSDGTRALSRGAQTSMSNKTWYDMWKVQKNTIDGAKTYMVWGCAYDQVMMNINYIDMSEGLREWTMENIGTTYRSVRHGTTRYNDAESNILPSAASANIGSRMMLY